MVGTKMKQVDKLISELHRINTDIRLLETEPCVTGLTQDSNKLVRAAGINILTSRKMGMLEQLRDQINFHVEV